MIPNEELYQKAFNEQFLTKEEALQLYLTAPTSDLMFVADTIRKNKTNKK